MSLKWAVILPIDDQDLTIFSAIVLLPLMAWTAFKPPAMSCISVVYGRHCMFVHELVKPNIQRKPSHMWYKSTERIKASTSSATTVRCAPFWRSMTACCVITMLASSLEDARSRLGWICPSEIVYGWDSMCCPDSYDWLPRVSTYYFILLNLLFPSLTKQHQEVGVGIHCSVDALLQN